MTNETRLDYHLQQGIDAARSGQKETAKRHLISALKQNPNNIPALFWLAFVADTPQQSIRLLERVLTLEPDNEKAKTGLSWARRQLAFAASPQVEQQTTEMPDDYIRQQFSAGKAQQNQQREKAVKRRSRRKVDPMLAVALVLSIVALVTLGIWMLALAPADTLAAWLPTPVEEALVGSKAVKFVAAKAPIANEQPAEAATVAPARSKSSGSDTVMLTIPEAVETGVAEVNRSTLPQANLASGELMSVAEPPAEAVNPIVESEELSTALFEEGKPSAIQPESLIGPAEELLGGPRLFEPVEEALLYRQPAYPGEKWIEVNVTGQRVTAWEGNVPVMSFLSSTGLPNTPTVLGEYNIYWKLEKTLMVGPDYYLPDVPYTMYFYAGYALHGAYWHDNFGNPMSHGCVNLSQDNAKQLFEWANPVIPPGQTQVTSSADNPGTLVVVHQ